MEWNSILVWPGLVWQWCTMSEYKTSSPLLITYWLWQIFQQVKSFLEHSVFLPLSLWHWWERYCWLLEKLQMSAFGTPALYFWFWKTKEIPVSELIIIKRDQSLCEISLSSDTALILFLEVGFVSWCERLIWNFKLAWLFQKDFGKDLVKDRRHL